MAETLTAAHLAEDVRDLLDNGSVCDGDGRSRYVLAPLLGAGGNVLAVDLVRLDGSVARTAKITVELL